MRLRIVADPLRDAVLIDLRPDGDAGLRPYALLAPYLGGTGLASLAETALHGGRRVLRAEQGPLALALRRRMGTSAAPSAPPAPVVLAPATAGRTSNSAAP